MKPSKSLILPIDATEWLDFIQAMPEATLFHHPAWINLLSDYYGFRSFLMVIQDDQGRINAGIPLIEIDGWMQKSRLVSLPFTDHCAPLYHSENALAELVSAIHHLYKEGDYHQIELRWPYPPGQSMNIAERYILSKVKLEADPELLSSKIKRKYFRKITAAQERGVSVAIGAQASQLQEFYKLHWENRRKHGVPVQPWKYFLFLQERILRPGYGFLVNAYHDCTCVASGLFLAWNRTLIDKYSAVSAAGRHLLAMDLVLWTAISWGCRQGLLEFDMGRTDLADQGLRDYKNRWGALEVPLPYTYLSDLQSKVNDNQFIPIFKTAIRHSPLWVCRLTGELFFQYFA